MDARKTAVENTSETITVSRAYDAPRRLVFAAWSTAEHLARWWGPHGFTAPECVVEFRKGGRLEILMKGFGGGAGSAGDGRSPKGGALVEHWMRGTFDEIVDQERIAFTVFVEGAEGPIHTLVTFAESAGRTTMTVTQTVPKNPMMARGQVQGWTEQLERLAAELS